MKSNQKQKAISFTEGFAKDALHLLDYLNPTNYTEHELASIDGVAGIEGLLKILPIDARKPALARAVEDGDFVFTHTEYNFFGSQIAIDIFRFEDGLIVEHWDNIQANAAPNASGHTMIDGPTEVTDLDKTEANKALVQSFAEEILIKGRLDKLAGYFHGDNYIQHNPTLSDGLLSFKQVLDKRSKHETIATYHTIRMVLGEGNFVLVVSEGTVAEKPTAFYDLFRVENEKLAEHWDLIQEIPAQEDRKNNNGKF
jgi:predicted SnoaL-like aldol condensation-catalyzing enzyme